MKVQGAVLLSATEDYKAPAVCSAYLRCLSSVVDRCDHCLHSHEVQVLRLAAVPIIQNSGRLLISAKKLKVKVISWNTVGDQKNRRQWREKSEDGWTVSKFLVGALDYLQGKMSVVENGLNGIDFVGVWRSLAAGIDRTFFNGILMSNVKFYDGGVERFGSDWRFYLGHLELGV
ncbi:RINT1-like protein MAG2 [Prunus yedoensis var. nudiflora]|uniref:RINT1-like protein MAG2 n=1 Tax=Prunus yedoensis var. nudiflora TaxID=2094558 RepID=A0A314UYV5_PRUYE|nr:RINT1-like protein MAG2 [Prunus yedoensis var. nudiflora]